MSELSLIRVISSRVRICFNLILIVIQLSSLLSVQVSHSSTDFNQQKSDDRSIPFLRIREIENWNVNRINHSPICRNSSLTLEGNGEVIFRNIRFETDFSTIEQEIHQIDYLLLEVHIDTGIGLIRLGSNYLSYSGISCVARSLEGDKSSSFERCPPRGEFRSSMSFKGTISNVNKALQSLTYKSQQHVFGNDYLQISGKLVLSPSVKYTEQQQTLLSQNISTWECPIDVERKTSRPVILFKTKYVTIKEDESFTFGEVFEISIDDEVVVPSSSSKISVHVTTNIGLINGCSRAITYNGTLSSINNFVNELVYVPLSNANILTHGRDLINITVVDPVLQKSRRRPHTSESRSAYLSVYLKPVNDVPTLSAPTILTATRQTPTQLNISIEDADWIGTSFTGQKLHNEMMGFEISCAEGILIVYDNLASSNRLETKQLLGNGTLPQLQDIFSGKIFYKWTLNSEMREDLVTVSIYDGQLSSSSDIKVVTLTFPVILDHTEPVLQLSSILDKVNYTVLGDSVDFLPPVALLIPDLNMEEIFLSANISCAHGLLTLPHPYNQTIIWPEIDLNEQSIEVKASNFTSMSSIFSSLLYSSHDSYSGREHLSIDMAFVSYSSQASNFPTFNFGFEFFVEQELDTFDIITKRNLEFESKTLYFLCDFLHLSQSDAASNVELYLSVLTGSLFLSSCLLESTYGFKILDGDLDADISHLRVRVDGSSLIDFFSMIQYHAGDVNDTLHFEVNRVGKSIVEKFNLGIRSNEDLVSLVTTMGTLFQGYEDTYIVVPGLNIRSTIPQESIINFQLSTNQGRIMLPRSEGISLRAEYSDHSYAHLLNTYVDEPEQNNPVFVVGTYPMSIETVSEVQRFSCSSMNSSATFRLALLGRETELIRTSDRVSPRDLPACTTNMDGVVFPSPCAGDGSTLLEKLEKLELVRSVSVELSQDRVCTNHSNTKPYSILITFHASGDLPLVSPIRIDNDIMLNVTEEIKGIAPIQLEVQRLSCDYRDLNSNFKLRYLSEYTKPISCLSTSEELLRALEGIQSVSILNVTRTNTLVSSVWYITFSQIGDMKNLNVIQLSDKYLNITVNEVVKGLAPIWGDFSLAISSMNETQYTIPLNVEVTALEMEHALNQIPLGSKAKVTKEANGLLQHGHYWLIYMNDKGKTNVNLANINLHSHEESKREYNSDQDSSSSILHASDIIGNFCDILSTKTCRIHHECNDTEICPLSEQTSLINLSVSSSRLKGHGTLALLSRSLSSLLFRGAQNWNSLYDENASIDIKLSVSDSSFSSQDVVYVKVDPVNDFPILHFERHDFTTFEDTALSIHGITVSDPDIGPFLEHSHNHILSLIVEVENGSISLKNTSNDIVLSRDDVQRPAATFKITGTVKSINKAISTLVFTPPQNWSSCRKGCANEVQLVRVLSFENSTAFNNFILGTSLEHCMQLPVGISGTVLQSKLRSLPGLNHIIVSSKPTNISNLYEYEVTFYQDSGQSQIGDQNTLFSRGLGSVSVEVHEMQKGKAEASWLSFIIDDMSAIGEGDRLTANELIGVYVAPVNDAPTIFAETNTSMLEDTLLSLSYLDVRISDIDDNKLNLTAYFSRGRFFDGNEGFDKLEIIDSIININRRLRSLMFMPPEHYHGLSILYLSVSDFQAVSKRSIPIILTSVDDAPQITTSNKNYTTYNDGESIELDAIMISDVDFLDHWSNSLTFVVRTQNGFLKTKRHSDRAISMNGNPDFINRALLNLEYLADRNFVGEDVITLTLTSNLHEVSTNLHVTVKNEQISFHCIPPSFDLIEVSEDSTWQSSRNETFQVRGRGFDKVSTKFNVYLTPMHGTISLRTPHLKPVKQFTNISYLEVKEVFKSMVYVPPMDKFGIDVLVVSIYGSSGELLADTRQYFSIVAEDDPLQLYTLENITSIHMGTHPSTALPVIGFSDMDINSQIGGQQKEIFFQTNATCLNGKLEFEDKFLKYFLHRIQPCNILNDDEGNHQSLCFISNFKDTNDALNAIKYFAHYGRSHVNKRILNDTVTVIVHELDQFMRKKANDFDEIKLQMFYEKYNASSPIWFESDDFEIDEDTPFLVRPRLVSEKLPYNQHLFNLRLSCKYCLLTNIIPTPKDSKVVGDNSSDIFFHQITYNFLSSISSEGFQYLPHSNFYGFDQIKLHLTALNNAHDPANTYMSVRVNPFFDPPHLLARNISVLEDSHISVSTIEVIYIERQQSLDDQLSIQFVIPKYPGTLTFIEHPGIFLSSINETFVEIKGSTDNLNQALSSGHLRFVPKPEWHGIFYLTVAASVGSITYDKALVQVNVRHVYDPPQIIISPDSFRWESGENHESFNFLPVSITVKAVELEPNALLNCNITTSVGSIALSKHDFNIVPAGEALMIYKPLVEINEIFDRIAYFPPFDFTGIDTVSVCCSDGKIFSPIETLSIFIPAMKAPPIISVGVSEFEVKQGTCSSLNSVLKGVHVRAVGAYPQSERNLISAHLSSSSMELCFRISEHKIFMESILADINCQTINLTASVEAINSALRYLEVCAKDIYATSGIILLEAAIPKGIYGSAITSSLSVPFKILHVWSPPSINVVNSTLLTLPEGTLLILGDHINIKADMNSKAIKLFVEVTDREAGSLSLMPGKDLIIDDQAIVSRDELAETNAIEFEGTLDLVRQVTRDIIFTPTSNWFGSLNNSDGICVQVSDDRQLVSSLCLSLFIHPVNDPPHISLENHIISLSGRQSIHVYDEVNISVGDIDIEYMSKYLPLPLFNVTLTTESGGLLSFQHQVDGCILDDYSKWKSSSTNISLQGHIDTINAALKMIIYTCCECSKDKIYVMVNDNGNYGLGGSLSTSSVLIIQETFIFPNLKQNFSDSCVDASFKTSNLPRGPFVSHEALMSDNRIDFAVPSSIKAIPAVPMLLEDIQINIEDDYHLIGFMIESCLTQIWSIEILSYDKERIFIEWNGVRSSHISPSSSSIDVYNQLLTVFDTPFEVLDSDSGWTVFVFCTDEGSNLSIISDSNISDNNITSTSMTSIRPRCQFQLRDSFQPGVVHPLTNVNENYYVLQGVANPINKALESLLFIAPENVEGIIYLECSTGIVDDVTVPNRFDINSVFSKSRKFIRVEIEPAIKPPVLKWHGSSISSATINLECFEDTFLSFEEFARSNFESTGLRLYDSNNSINGLIYFTMRTFHGYATTSMRSMDGYEWNTSIEFNGTTDEINELLKSLAYKPDPNWWGFDEIELRLSLENFLLHLKINVFVIPTNDQPIFLRRGSEIDSNEIIYLTGVEDAPLIIDDLNVMDYDADIFNEYEYKHDLQVTIEARNGSVISQQANILATFCRDEKVSEPYIYRNQGTLDMINNALAELVFIPDCNFYGNTTIFMKVNDFGLRNMRTVSNQLHSEVTINIEVTSINDKPFIHFPTELLEFGRLQTFEDTYGAIGMKRSSLVPSGDFSTIAQGFHIMSQTSISISDIDLIDNVVDNIEVFISCLHGTFSLQSFDNSIALINSEGKHENKLHMKGSIENINANLQGLLYRGLPNRNSHKDGQENVTISVTDSAGSTISSWFIVYVEERKDSLIIKFMPKLVENDCLASNSSPSKSKMQCSNNQELFIAANRPTTISGIFLRNIDDNTSDITLDIFTHLGFIKIHREVPIAIITGEQGLSKHLCLRGSIDNLNNVLNTLQYTSNSSRDALDTLTVVASTPNYDHFGRFDQKSTFDDDKKQTLIEIPIFVQGEAEVPSLKMLGRWILDEDTPSMLPEVFIKGDNLTQVKLVISCSAGFLEFPQQSQSILLSNVTLSSGSVFEGWGTILSWNSVINGALYVPDDNHNTHNGDSDSIMFELFTSDDFYLKQNLQVDVEPVNDAPRIILRNNASLTPMEDEDFILSFQVEDIDIGNNINLSHHISVTVSVYHGSLRLGNTEGIWFSTEVTEPRHIEFKGTLVSVNNALNNLVYRGDINFDGVDTIEVFVSDDGNVGKGNVLSSIYTRSLHIVPVNDKPSIGYDTIPILCREQSWCSVGATAKPSIKDSDSNSVIFAVEVSAESGFVFILDNNPSNYKPIQSKRRSIYLEGNITAINSALSQLVYFAEASISADILSIYVHSDGGCDGCLNKINEQTAKSEIFLLITGKENVLPVICKADLVNISYFYCIEDSVCSVHGFTIIDPDSSHSKVEISVDNGSLSIADLRKKQELVIDKSNSTLKLFGTLSVVNHALAGLVYKSNNNYYGRDTLVISVSDLSDDWVSYTTTIEVSNSPDKSFIFLPFSVGHINEDEFFTIHGVNITHPDERDNLNSTIAIELRIASKNGRFQLSSHLGINIISMKISEQFSNNTEQHDRHWFSEVVLNGLLSNVNNAIKDITFTGNLNWNSISNFDEDIFLEFSSKTINLVGNYSIVGDNFVYEDIARMMFFVKAVNDSPVLIFGNGLELNCDANQINCMNDDGQSPKRISLDYIELMEDESKMIPVQVRDADNDMLVITITAFSGVVSILNIRDPPDVYLKLYHDENIIFFSGDGHRDSYVKFKGSVASVNKKLADLVFFGEKNFHGYAWVQIIVEDSNGKNSTETVSLNILPLPDDVDIWFPVNALNEEITIYVDEGQSIKLNHMIAIPESFEKEAKSHKMVHQWLQLVGLHLEDLGNGQGLYQAFALWTPDVIHEHANAETYLYNVTVSVNIGWVRMQLPLSLAQSDSFKIHNDFGQVLEFTGSLSDINKAAGFISFFTEDNSNETGHVDLSVMINMLAPTCNEMIYERERSSCNWNLLPQPINRSRQLFIVEVNSPPAIHWTEFNYDNVNIIESFSSYKSCKGSGKWTDVGGFEINDTDVGQDGIMTVTIFLTEGNVRLSSNTGLSFSSGDGYHGTVKQIHQDGAHLKMRNMMRFDGKIVPINRALSRIQYSNCNKLDESETDKYIDITIEVDDNGFSGRGGPLKESLTVQVFL